MAPDMINNLDAKETTEIAQRIRDYQTARSLSDNAMIRKFPGLGSTKTYSKILQGDFTQLDPEKQLLNYRVVINLIESLSPDTDKKSRDPIYDDLSSVATMKRVFFDIMSTETNRRVVVLLGDTGLAKTTSCKIIFEKYGQRIRWTEANEAWGDSPMAYTSALLESCGVKEKPFSLTDRLAKVIDLFNERRACTIIDEAHHMGPRTLNLTKTLINKTPGEFVLSAMPTLWARLQRKAYEETRQLTGNRLAEVVRIDGIRESDVRKMITRRPLVLSSEDLPLVTKHILDIAPKAGNLAFVAKVIAAAYDVSGEELITRESMFGIISEELRKSGQEQRRAA